MDVSRNAQSLSPALSRRERVRTEAICGRELRNNQEWCPHQIRYVEKPLPAVAQSQSTHCHCGCHPAGRHRNPPYLCVDCGGPAQHGKPHHRRTTRTDQENRRRYRPEIFHSTDCAAATGKRYPKKFAWRCECASTLFRTPSQPGCAV